MKQYYRCNRHGKVPNQTVRLSNWSYRVLSWLTYPRCRGTGKVAAAIAMLALFLCASTADAQIVRGRNNTVINNISTGGGAAAQVQLQARAQVGRGLPLFRGVGHNNVAFATAHVGGFNGSFNRTFVTANRVTASVGHSHGHGVNTFVQAQRSFVPSFALRAPVATYSAYSFAAAPVATFAPVQVYQQYQYIQAPAVQAEVVEAVPSFQVVPQQVYRVPVAPAATVFRSFCY